MRDFVDVAGRAVPLVIVKHPRARRYLLRLRPDGQARLTVPRGGTVAEAKAFAVRSAGWLQQQLKKLATHPEPRNSWRVGDEIWLRGQRVRIQLDGSQIVCFGEERLPVKQAGGDLKAAIQRHLWRKAAQELPARVAALAAAHRIHVTRVSVRNQRSRWGSCSRRGTISLNWRLLQAPEMVRDYIILHELAHRQHMNHSTHFWQEVARLCPDFREAERWLKQHGRTLLR